MIQVTVDNSHGQNIKHNIYHHHDHHYDDDDHLDDDNNDPGNSGQQPRSGSL